MYDPFKYADDEDELERIIYEQSWKEMEEKYVKERSNADSGRVEEKEY